MEESYLKNQLNQMAFITKESNAGRFYQAKADAATDISVVRCCDVLTQEELRWVRSILKPRMKECYRNALVLAQHFGCGYIEGQMLLYFGIDHAFNKIRGKYIDVTKEFALGEDPTKTEYVSIGEYSSDEATKVALKTRQYGNVFEYYFLTK